MKKGKVNIYQYNSEGKYEISEANVDYDEYSVNERIDDHAFNEKSETEGLPKEVYEVLHTNPFLYIKDDLTDNYVVSIEDFYVSYKKYNVSLGEVFRGDKFKKKQKKKIFNNQMKIWNNEASLIIKETFNEFGENIKVSQDQSMKGLNFGEKLGLFLGVLIPGFLLLNIVPWLAITNNIIKYIAIGIIALAVIGIILFSVQSARISKQKSLLRQNKKKHRKYFNETTNDLKKKSKKISKYYLNALNKKTFFKAPLPIDKVLIGGEKIEFAKVENENIKNKCLDVLKGNERFNGYYHIPKFLSFITWIPSVGYLGYLLVLKLIDYLK